MLGWDEWFTTNIEERGLTEEQLARVVAVDREQLCVVNGSGEFRAKLSGHFLYTTTASCDFPCVGDWVRIQYSGSDEYGIIHEVIKRKTFLRRKSAGDTVDYQMIASNIDVALIVQSCHFDFNIKRLERYLVMVACGHVHPVILLTKTDMISPDNLQQQIDAIRSAGIDAEIIALSNLTGEGVTTVRDMLFPGKTYCLLGSSGVGKSTLINHLIDHRTLTTNTVSGTGEGRHTTVRRELIILDNGAMLIDNPGMREFGILGADEGIDNNFADIHALAAGCRYGDCSHISEPGCAVIGAIEEGTLNQAHYDNFIKLRSESAFHTMTYVEKRTKERAFGRFIKTAKKDLGAFRKNKYD